MPSTPVRVLLVDDHPVMRDGLQQLLERTGEFEVVGHAGDGEEAERVAKEVVPDLVIMDVLMPGRDGIDACREIIDALADVSPVRKSHPFIVRTSRMIRSALFSRRLDGRAVAPGHRFSQGVQELVPAPQLGQVPRRSRGQCIVHCACGPKMRSA